MNLTSQEYNRNFKAFIWHGIFLALTTNFAEVNTIIPSMLIKIGASPVHLGIITTLMLGGASIMQLVFSRLLSNQPFKKKFLLLGINLRVLSLYGIAMLFVWNDQIPKLGIFILVYVLIVIFSFSGSFANISYMDILGKGLLAERRKAFFSLKQLLGALGIISSAFLVREILKSTVYPNNYAIIFTIAASLLLIASLGFYRLKEKEKSGRRSGNKQFVQDMIREIKENSNLRNYLIIINFLGIGLSILPFLVLIAKESTGLSFDKIGNFILFQTLGMIGGSAVIYFLSKRIKYKQILFGDLLLALAIPVLALWLRNSIHFHVLFILTGLFASTFKVSSNGILIEISNTENRTLITGIAGVGNILPMLFPILAGIIIAQQGYDFVFLLAAVLALSSGFFIQRLNCSKS